MFTWAQIALALLKVVNAILGYARERNLIAAGEDAAIGRAAQETLRQTQWGREIAERIDAMDKGALDDLTDALGSDDLGNPGRR